MKISGRVGCMTANSGVDFGGDLDHDVDAGIFKGIFFPLRIWAVL